MGDYRFSFKAEFQMGDVSDKTDMWLNYTPRDGIIDHRVIEWLEDLFEKGEQSINDAIYGGEIDETARQHEEKERAEYERLKAKFESN